MSLCYRIRSKHFKPQNDGIPRSGDEEVGHSQGGSEDITIRILDVKDPKAGIACGNTVDFIDGVAKRISKIGRLKSVGRSNISCTFHDPQCIASGLNCDRCWEWWSGIGALWLWMLNLVVHWNWKL